MGRVAEAADLSTKSAGRPNLESKPQLSGMQAGASAIRLSVRTGSRVAKATASIPKSCGFDSRFGRPADLVERSAVSATFPTELIRTYSFKTNEYK